MGFMDDFARDKSGAQLTMLVAIALLFVSQFFLYLNDKGTGFLTFGPNFTSTTHHFTSFDQIGTGWHFHPHAFIILPVLAIAFLNKSILANPTFQRWGWWAALALVIFATAPGAPFRNAGGAQLGGIAVLTALLAAIRNTRRAAA